ncbi:protein gamma response 1 [Typha latifolia]|uniref:protein gamma response 1 n=1 Tax=Typha latifolia TaxID=4733 RepID=UPI003C2C070F
MEVKMLDSPKHDFTSDTDDFKYICGLSTILVATIQEVKDRVSQIEFIFCSQLFPNIQSKSKIFQKRLADVRKGAEHDWKKREASLLNQIDELLMEKQVAQERIEHLNSSLEEIKMKLMSNEELGKKHEFEKRQLLDRVEDLKRNEQTIAELKRQLDQKTDEVAERKESQKGLLQQMELNDQKLLFEETKRRDVIEDFNKLKTSYKHLKSQYTFLVGKIGNIKDKNHCLGSGGEHKDSPSFHLYKRSLQDSEEKDQEDVHLDSDPRELKNATVYHEKVGSNQDIGSAKSLHNNSCIELSSSSTVPPSNLVGTKRASSCWRDTRARQEPAGRVDPHDDFLDTPMEVVRNLNKNPPEEAQAFPVPPPQDMDFNNSEDETQDMNIPEVSRQQNISILGPANKSFKYIQPVRKKAERENLKGIECKQCKKFYDAVLPDGGGEGDTNSKSLRCEHHDGVSRHRYKYAPPMTPEGFWNIGFDSDI